MGCYDPRLSSCSRQMHISCDLSVFVFVLRNDAGWVYAICQQHVPFVERWVQVWFSSLQVLNRNGGFGL